MQNEKNTLAFIEANYSNFTSNEKHIADFFLSNDKKMDFSARHISSLLFTSESSLSRFAKKCGFSGYRQFIYYYQESFLPNKLITDSSIRNIFFTYQELLSKAYALINEEQIKKVSLLIAQKRRIFVYGKGSSGVAAQELMLRFMRLGIDIECITDNHIMTMNSAVVGPECLVIGITVSGTTQEVLHSLKTAKAKGAATVLISSCHRREWDSYCDEILPIATKERLDLGKLISPQFPILVLCDVLYANVIQCDRNGKEELHEFTLLELNAMNSK